VVQGRRLKRPHERLYRSLYRIRRAEEEIARIYPTDKIKSPVHLSIGQESVSVGVCEALRPEDVVFGSYRSHALYLAKGGDLKKMMAELFGKATGCAMGKGGSMHLIDPAHGVMGTSAVVGSTIPPAVGYAYALKIQSKKAIVASFFGDGAVEEGAFHESLNFAKLKNVPILFVCENNLYAIHTHQRHRQSLDNICDRARAYGIPAERFEEDDVLKIFERMTAAVELIRSGASGPLFFECRTYRLKEHVGPHDDFHLGYRSRTEAEPWVQNDSCRRLAALLDPAARARIEAEVREEIRDAIEFAEQSPFPVPADLYSDVFKDA
jgi:TPP-dependent pyruvate/acetoin dehydrogenase alpha subunit